MTITNEAVRRTTAGAAFSTATKLHTVSIAPLTATPTAGLLTIYDNTAASGTVIYSEWVFATAVGHSILLDALCRTGVYVAFDGTLANVSITCTGSA